MGRRNRVLHAVALTACFWALARPDRLWSSVPPLLEPAVAVRLLGPLAEPWTAPLDEDLRPALEERALELRGYRRVQGAMEPGETLAAVLERSGLSAGDAVAFGRALKRVFDPRRARPGDGYGVLLDPAGRLAEFTYRRSPLERYSARAEGLGWHVERVDVPVVREEAGLAGRVSGSLFDSFREAGGDADLVLAFAALFAWDLDFSQESREGDEFRVIYETLRTGGEPAGNGRILAAEYRGERGVHAALYYRSGAAEGYFDPQGRSVRKTFLRSPLEFSRVSSRFSLARRHPVLDVIRPHRGVDYAAPAGTPVWAVADGTVVEAGWRGEAGNAVTLRHARGFETHYNHLASFGRGVRAGGRVKQGQVIGTVGSTGLSTGPHLDFRVKKDGRWVDPLRQTHVPGEPVPGAERAAYQAWAKRWLERLGGLAPPARVALAGDPG